MAVAEAVSLEVEAEVEVEVEVVLSLYVVKRLAPPQYCVLLPLQRFEQPLAVGSFPPAASTAPVPKVLPQ